MKRLTKKVVIGTLAVIAVVGFMVLFVDVIPPKAMTISAIGETFFRIGLYAQQSNDIPLSLSVLPRRVGYANQTVDAWRRPLKYEVTPDGVITLSSLGRDGKPSGEGDDEDIAKSYHARRPDGTLWATSEMWIVEAKIRKEEVH